MNEEITPATAKTSTGLPPNVAGLLCYLAGWITGLVFFLIEKESRFVRFHAMQSMITFGSITALLIAFGYIPVIGWLAMPFLVIAQVVLWILLMIKAFQGVHFKLPVIGDLAEKYI